jgi:hypothetical protein
MRGIFGEVVVGGVGLGRNGSWYVKFSWRYTQLRRVANKTKCPESKIKS